MRGITEKFFIFTPVAFYVFDFVTLPVGNGGHSDGGRGSCSDFVACFILGGAIFGTLAYAFAPQLRKSLLNEDEHGFRRAKWPIYYEDGLEKTRQTLNDKISQLNLAIDNVSSRLISQWRLIRKLKQQFVHAIAELQS
ncbi:hypothetical protein MLD38_030312 [Melastoma candidum]|uniref:Uncharacterized protein n=1 Tax=Melastoma candidum TaxID=119954 RepID=A0ACB9ML88_9MYRT|nr:hypothetical protein MLD38_030312 [Melastoma candidum]